MKQLKEIAVDYNAPVDEMTDSQIRELRTAIQEFFGSEVITNHRGEEFQLQTNSALDECFGLPYTSSSAFAGLWNTNSEVFVADRDSIQGFTMLRDGRGVMLTHERDETEHWYDISA